MSWSAFLATWRAMLTDKGALTLLFIGGIIYSFFYPLPYSTEIVQRVPSSLFIFIIKHQTAVVFFDFLFICVYRVWLLLCCINKLPLSIVWTYWAYCISD